MSIIKINNIYLKKNVLAIKAYMINNKYLIVSVAKHKLRVKCYNLIIFTNQNQSYNAASSPFGLHILHI